MAWSPTILQVFHILLIFRVLSAFYNNINDCDETYNYWEPAHFFMHGTGFQTWEYSPLYAIRSYAYILLHVLPLLILGTQSKIVQFFTLRVILALICTICETYFYRAVKNKYGDQIALWTFLFMATSCGMFIASTAFLPSSFTMYCTMVAMAAWFDKKEWLSIIAIAFGSIIGWPFAAALGIPVACDVFFRQRRISYFLIWASISFVVIAGPVAYVDSKLYGKFVLAPWNIILYNIFGKGGPNLYGTESWTYYFMNGFLNFNILFILSLLCWPLIELKVLLESCILRLKHKPATSYRLIVFPMIIWMGIFFTRAHKEERFLFPIYPLICLSGSTFIYILQDITPTISYMIRLHKRVRAKVTYLVAFFGLFLCGVHAVLSCSRGLALHYGYQAPMQLYMDINSQRVLGFTLYMREINVCVGKEWYRYSSSFFLPDNRILPLRARWHLRYLRSDFRGQLPQPYSSLPNATAIIPSNMNDMNQEEVSRYFDVQNCQFLIDSESTLVSEHEPAYFENQAVWERVLVYKFLDTKNSNRFFRAFYFPGLSDRYVKYIRYFLLRNKNGNFVGV